MAAFDVLATLRAVESHLAAGGAVGGQRIGEPTEPPDASERPYAAVWMSSTAVAALTAGNETIELHVLTIRLYRTAFGDPAETSEVELAQSSALVLNTILADATLGSSVRSLDPGGIYGVRVETQWGFVDVGGKMFRIADITLPFIVDASATLT